MPACHEASRRRQPTRTADKTPQSHCELFFVRVRPGAETFLLDPADHVRRAILDGNVSGFCRAEKHHRLTIDKRDIREIDRHLLIRGGFTGEQPFDFGQVLFRQLPAEADRKRLLVFFSWTDLQHFTPAPGIDAY